MARIYKLAKLADEQGAYGITCTFKANNVAVDAASIVSLAWWLTDLSGVVVNSRSNVTVSSIANPYTVVLTGADLQIFDKDAPVEGRILTLKGTYNSTLGDGLAFTAAVLFDVLNLLVVADDLYVSVIDVSFSADMISME